jgi:hypothetical protein
MTSLNIKHMADFFSKEEQYRVFYPLKRHLGIPDKIDLPRLDVIEDASECRKWNQDLLEVGNYQEEVPWFKRLNSWFDRLGWYNSSVDKSDKVFLCKPLIENFARECNWNIKAIVQLVYAHELAHYFHFKMNGVGWQNNRINQSCLMGHWERYVESFAQLCTHAIAKNFDTFGNEHLPILRYVTEHSPDQYRYYRSLTKVAREVIVDFYLGTGKVYCDIEKELQERQKDYIKGLQQKRFENDVRGEIETLADLSGLGFEDESLDKIVYQPFQNMKYQVPVSYSNE